METKTCWRCGQDHPLTAFYRNKSRADGLSTECKPCRRALSASVRQLSPRKPNADYSRRYYAKPENRAKQAARCRLASALRAGKLTKPTTCTSCGVEASGWHLQAHHDDYDRPLDVRWLCAACHTQLHTDRRNAPSSP